MDEAQRGRLAGAVRDTRRARYETKFAAYTDAGVNSATWDRIEKGLSVKEHSLVRVIKTLWPPTGGDWSEVPRVRFAPGVIFTSEGEGVPEKYRSAVEATLMELIERVELLEKQAYATRKERD